MNHALWTGVSVGFIMVLSVVTTNAFTLTGKVSDDSSKAKNERAEEAQRNAPHKCYDYSTVEERFPVRWCTQSDGHIWDHKDPGQQQSWVPQATWEFFEKF